MQRLKSLTAAGLICALLVSAIAQAAPALSKPASAPQQAQRWQAAFSAADSS